MDSRSGLKRVARWQQNCIFLLTFARGNSIYESQRDFLIADNRQENQINEERNQESTREEKSPREEKEVTGGIPKRMQTDNEKGSGNGALFYLFATLSAIRVSRC
jgi:hypothetical protein